MSDKDAPCAEVPSTPDSAKADRRCSECGWGTPDHKSPIVLWPRIAFWLIPMTIFGLALGMSVLAPPSEWGVWHVAELVDPVVTRGDLRRIAAGETPVRDERPVHLASALLDHRQHRRVEFGEIRYQAMLVPPPSGVETEWLTFGWPLPFISHSVTQHYQNILAREGPLDAFTFGTPEANALNNPAPTADIHPRVVFPRFDTDAFGISWTRAPEQTRGTVIQGGVSWLMLLAALVIAFVIAWLARRLVSAVFRNRDPQHVRRWRAWTTTLAFAVVLFMPWRHSRIGTNLGYTPSSIVPAGSTLQPGAVLTGLSTSQLRAFPTPAAADQALASDILARLGDTSDAPADDVLLAGECMEYMPLRQSFASPLSLYAIGLDRITFERCPDFGVKETVTMPKATVLQFERFGGVSLLYASGERDDPALEISVFFPGLLAAIGVSMLPGLLILAFHRRATRVRGDQRLRANLCPSCAHPLDPASPA